MDAEVLKADIAELERVLATVARPNNKHHLESYLSTLRTKLGEAEKREAARANAAKTASVADTTTYTTISQFGWEQEGKIIKVYVSLDNVGKLPAENITCDFGTTSFDLKVMNHEGKNYRLYPKSLTYPIATQDCKFTVRANRIVVTLAKQESKHWDKLEGKSIPAPKPDLSADPSAGIMDMMKNMYEEGDEEMKRTIAKAWTESRDKQGAGLPEL